MSRYPKLTMSTDGQRRMNITITHRVTANELAQGLADMGLTASYFTDRTKLYKSIQQMLRDHGKDRIDWAEEGEEDDIAAIEALIKQMWDVE